MNIRQRFLDHQCKRKGHDWFPTFPASQFVPITKTCFRCRKIIYLLPWGTCVGDGKYHLISEHYLVTPDDKLIEQHVGECLHPR